ncbi:TPA: hypothetical protein ACH3X1_007387 [Trebouxia sp. C0004]
MLSSDFEPELIEKIDSYLEEGLKVPIVGEFESFCSAQTLDNYANAHNLTAAEKIQTIVWTAETYAEREFNISRYGTDDFSALFSNVLSSLLIVLRQGENFLC